MSSILSRSITHLGVNQNKWLQLLRLQSNRENHVISSRLLTKPLEVLASATFSQQNMQLSNNISSFYKGSSILITGATGFLGKVLLEKLLRTCGGLENIYVLIREKNGLNADQRLKVLLGSPVRQSVVARALEMRALHPLVFDKLKKSNPEYLEKLKGLSGDVAEPNLGLSKSDTMLIMDKVDIVFHSAATVRLNEELQTALKLNTLGTMQMAKLCKNIKNLKSFVYVSTAYANSHAKVVEEKVYEPPYVPSSIIDCVETLPPDTIKMIKQQIIGKYRNTYLFSKALAESIVLEYSKTIPATIVRPSIVQSSWKEPFPGWVQSSSGGSLIPVQYSQGLLKCLCFEIKIIADIVPVDVAANTAIAAAWHSTMYRSDAMKVYNCTSGQVNPLVLGQWIDLIIKYSRDYPTIHALFYPSYIYTNNATIGKVLHFLFHYIPAVIFDVYLFITNRKPRMRKFSQAMQEFFNDVSFMTRDYLDFQAPSFKSLMEAVKNAEDGKAFDIDMRKENGFDWDAYMKDYVLGIRQHVLKDDISSLDDARIKLKRIYWFTKAVQVISLTTLISLVVF